MTKNEIFQLVNKFNNADIQTMIYRETVFDIISFGKSSKIHLATTASIDRVKRTLKEYNVEDFPEEKDTVKIVIEGDTIFLHSIFKMSYDEFTKTMVTTDLTFNSLLMKPNGQIYDIYNGLDDLRNKKLSFVKNFNEDVKTHLALNCIRYIYKNNFSYDDRVKAYIEKTLSHFSKNEKNNALFYLVEFINKDYKDDRISLILNDNFFKSDKNPDIKFDNYVDIIERIGKEQFIFLLLILLNVNINKTRFSTIINADEFKQVKEAFAIDLCEEIPYYELKEKMGYEFLSTIIALQREYANITCREYKESDFHKKTIFDVIEQNSTFETASEDLLLEETSSIERISIPKRDAFDFANEPSQTISDIDFSSIFSEDNSLTEDNESFEENTTIEDNTEKENVEKNIIENIEENTVEEDISINKDEVPNDITLIDDVSPVIESSEDIVSDISNNEVTESNIPVISENNANTDIEEMLTSKITEEPIAVSDVETEVEKQSDFTLPSDISDILNEEENDEKVVTRPKSKRRSKNPNFGNFTEETAEEVKVTIPVSEPESVINSISEDTFKLDIASEPETTPVAEDTSTELNLDEMFATDDNKAVKKAIPSSKTDSLIDSIFEEEVVLPEVKLSSEFGSVMSQMTEETKNDVVQSNRSVVTETLLSEKVSDAELLGVQSQPVISQPDISSENIDINEQDLEEILAELNGKKKNSFLDDDSNSDEEEDEISTSFNNFIPSQTPSSMPMTFSTIPAPTPTQKKAQDSDDDFFKSLNDDFAEIVGGNA